MTNILLGILVFLAILNGPVQLAILGNLNKICSILEKQEAKR